MTLTTTLNLGRALVLAASLAAALLSGPAFAGNAAGVRYETASIDGLDIAYRDAGPKDAPVVLLLHGFPTSSHMFRDLIPELADQYRVIAPDYPGFGASSMPTVDAFDYSFDSLAGVVMKLTDQLGLKSYSLYLMDYGAPVGFRLATARPDRVESLIIQNGNAYDEGLREFWDPIKAYWADRTPETTEPLRGLLALDATKWQYTHGVRDQATISPDTWMMDQAGLDREGNQAIQLELFHSYGTNPPLYPAWQAWMRKAQPPTLIVWGTGDHIFPVEGAHPYKRDLKELEFHLFETGHFALEEDGDRIAELMRDFLERKVVQRRAAKIASKS